MENGIRDTSRSTYLGIDKMKSSRESFIDWLHSGVQHKVISVDAAYRLYTARYGNLDKKKFEVILFDEDSDVA